MNQSDNLQSAVGGRGSKDVEAETLASAHRATVLSLTDDLKNDSLLNTNKHRCSTDPQRVCRCSQLKMLRDKTLERIRQSMESENEKRLTVSENVSNESKQSEQQRESKRISSKLPDEPVRKSTKEERYSVIYDNDVMGGPFETIPDQQPRKDSARISAQLLEETGKPYRISDFQPARQSVRISTIPDDDIFEDLDEFHKNEQDRIQARKSTKEARYTEIFDNDFCGGVEPNLIGDQIEEQQQGGRRSTGRVSDIEELQKRISGRTSKMQRYTEIFDNDMMGCILEIREDVEEPVKETQRSTKEQRYSEIYENDMFGGPVDMNESGEFLNLDKLQMASKHSSLNASSIQVPTLDLRPSTRANKFTDNEKSSQTIKDHGSIVTIPQTKFDHGRSLVQRYDPGVPTMQSSVAQYVNLSATSSRLSAIKSTAADLHNQILKEQGNSNDLSGFVNEVATAANEIASILVESLSIIKQQNEAPTGHRCSEKYIICSDSCTSHLQPHQCSLQTPLCTASCMTCKPFADNAQRSSAQYDADDERSSLMQHKRDTENLSSSSLIPKQDQTSKFQADKHVCKCAQNYPELFKKVLSK